jgi:hypothetical protein
VGLYKTPYLCVVKNWNSGTVLLFASGPICFIFGFLTVSQICKSGFPNVSHQEAVSALSGFLLEM